VIVVDTSVIYALLDAADREHATVRRWYEATDTPLATTPLVVAEVDHLAGARAGTRAQRAWRADLAGGAYAVEWWDSAPRDLVEIAAQYGDLDVGLTDASLVALAHRLGTLAIATLDHRHFRAMRPLGGEPAFRLLPGDE
jgi:uncharacterized protein